MAHNILIIAGVLLLGYLVIKFVAKALIKLILILIILAFGGYLYFFWQGDTPGNSNEQFIIYKLEDTYCNQEKDRNTCECIIKPLRRDLLDDYSRGELKDMAVNHLRSIKIVTESLIENRKEIKNCLKERGALDKWSEFKEKLQNLK